MPMAWELEKRDGGVLYNTLTLTRETVPITGVDSFYIRYFAHLYSTGKAYQDDWSTRLDNLFNSTSLYTFKGGIEQLVSAVRKRARKLGVQFRYGTCVTEVTSETAGAQSSVRLPWTKFDQTDDR